MKQFGLIGHPLGHSLSPVIHERIMQLSGIEGTYTLYDIAPEKLDVKLPSLMSQLDGFNCTIPHKKALLSHTKTLDTSALTCGAVNTVYEGCGYNTDTQGFLASGISLTGKNVLLLGAGGTAHTMAAACVQKGASLLTIRARNSHKAEDLAAHLVKTFPDSPTRLVVEAEADASQAYEVVLNSTPVGMWPHGGGLPCETSLLHEGVLVFDPIYNPITTRLVLNARKHGAKAGGGLRMLVRQAIAAQRIWNPGTTFDVEAIERILLPELMHELLRSFPVKILITGFMGSGKSTVSRMLAQRLGMEFIDLDERIVNFAGCPIAEIFTRSGERYFRLLESAVAESALRHGGSAVVASGGGLPVSLENRNMIRSTNTLVVNIDISFEEAWRRIAADAARPLAADRPKAEALYAARTSIYDNFCDFKTHTMNKPEDVAAVVAAVLTDIG